MEPALKNKISSPLSPSYMAITQRTLTNRSDIKYVFPQCPSHNTVPCLSGAPSFDDEWRLIGMHHAALYVGHSNQDKKYVANEAASIAAIIAHIKENITEAEMPPEKYCLRKLGKPFEKSSSSSLFGWFSWPNSG